MARTTRASAKAEQGGAQDEQVQAQPSDSETDKATDAAAQAVQDKVDEETEQGFRGMEVDPTPNENYTLKGAGSGAPTPETDEDAAEAARKAVADVSARATGVAER